MNKYSKHSITLFLAVLLLGACKTENEPQAQNSINLTNNLIVGCEGTFTYGNATINLIDLSDSNRKVNLEIFKAANAIPLGDVLQSMTLINERIWLMVNGSGKIHIIHKETGKLIHSIQNAGSPRYAVQASQNKVYVTDLKSNHISIYDSETYEKTGQIKCNGWTEELIKLEDEVWVTNYYRPYIYIIDVTKDQIKDSVGVANGGSAILADRSGMVWVLCSGDYLKQKNGGVFGIRKSDRTLVNSIHFSDHNFNPIRLRENYRGDSLFFIFNGVYRIHKMSSQIPSQPWLAQSNGSGFYGLGVNPNNGNLFIGDAKDYLSKGSVLEYSKEGNLLYTHKTGVSPSSFLFLK
ncbi:MAG: hypothetical protein H6605_08550 [Flavobacteriales bacterium]|nr:hypothetical protein [Flavobacteriales bacterium]